MQTISCILHKYKFLVFYITICEVHIFIHVDSQYKQSKNSVVTLTVVLG